MKLNIMIVAGEASGDLHASSLVREMKKINPDLHFSGIGGDKMKNEGVELFYHVNEMSVLGFGDVIKSFPFFRRVFKYIVASMKKMKPDLLILIDYPGLNFKFAKEAQKLSIPVFYYIAPQVWAWGSGRIKKMTKIIDKMGVILPFEEDLFSSAGIQAHFVGHPLLDSFTTKMTKSEFFTKNNIKNEDKIIGLLPGSRTHEVNRLLPVMLDTAKELNLKFNNLKFIVARTSTISDQTYDEIAHDLPNVQFIYGQTYEIMNYSDFLIVKSGTSTLESALAKTPFIIVYKVDPFSYFIGRILVKIKFIGLVNVIAGKRIVPEFIQHECVTEKLVPTIETLLCNNDERHKMISEFEKLRHMLGEKGAAGRAAKLALETINRTELDEEKD